MGDFAMKWKTLNLEPTDRIPMDRRALIKSLVGAPVITMAGALPSIAEPEKEEWVSPSKFPKDGSHILVRKFHQYCIPEEEWEEKEMIRYWDSWLYQPMHRYPLTDYTKIRWSEPEEFKNNYLKDALFPCWRVIDGVQYVPEEWIVDGKILGKLRYVKHGLEYVI